MTYSNTAIKDFADFMEPTPPQPEPYKPPVIKPSVFRRPKFYPVEDVKKRRAELMAQIKLLDYFRGSEMSELHPCDQLLHDKLSQCKTQEDILIFLRDYEFYPCVFDSNPNRANYLKAIIDRIDEILETEK